MKKVYNGFTLIEILVVIAIMMILFVGASSINFNYATDKEFLNSFTNRIHSIIEKRRNDALIGRSFSASLIIPETYKINFSTASSGSLMSSYSTGGVFFPVSDDTITLKPYESISRISCYTPDRSSSGNTNNVELLLNKKTLSSSGCSIGGAIIEIQTSYKTLNKSIFINTLTGRIEKK